MMVVFETIEGNELREDHRLTIIPREGEKIIINTIVYRVDRVLHDYDANEINISLYKL